MRDEPVHCVHYVHSVHCMPLRCLVAGILGGSMVDFLAREAGAAGQCVMPWLRFPRLFRRAAPGAGPVLSPSERLVAEQLVARGIRDRRVLDAMTRIDRRHFVADEQQDDAYDDRPLPTRHYQTISQPYIVARMIEALELAPHHRVLEVGAGSGYAAAVLACLAREVVAVERFDDLASDAIRRLAALNIANVRVVTGDGFHGWPALGPYDAILLSAAPMEVSPRLFEQLTPEGVLVAPEGPVTPSESEEVGQMLRRWRRAPDGTWRAQDLEPVRFVPLVESDARE